MDKKDPRLIYTELCKSYHAIRRFRVTLLGFLPLASGGAIGLLAKFGGNLSWHDLVVLGAVGVLVTVGLGTYERHNIRRCKQLLEQGVKLEKTIGEGQFTVHPCYDKRAKKITSGASLHAIAAAWVYGSVLIGWFYIIAIGVYRLLHVSSCQ